MARRKIAAAECDADEIAPVKLSGINEALFRARVKSPEASAVSGGPALLARFLEWLGISGAGASRLEVAFSFPAVLISAANGPPRATPALPFHSHFNKNK